MANILISKKDLETIAKKLKVTDHAKQRLIEARGEASIRFIKNAIINSPLAWIQDNGQIVTTLDEYSYFVIHKARTYYTVVSYLRKSINNYTAIDKFIFEYKGCFKKWDKENVPKKTKKI